MKTVLLIMRRASLATGALLEVSPYVPHNLVGVMAQNTPAAAKQKHVWSTGDQKIET